MRIFPDHRSYLGVMLSLAGLGCAVPGWLDPRAGLLVLSVGAFATAAGVGLLLRQGWARGVGVGAILGALITWAGRSWLAGAPVAWWHLLLAAWALWVTHDLATTPVTEEEEEAARERELAEWRLAEGRLRAKLAHLREHLEAVEESVREAHAQEGHALPFEQCPDCAEVHARLVETWTKLDRAAGHDPGP